MYQEFNLIQFLTLSLPLFLLLAENYRLYASVSFILIILVLGLPMWWKTTEIYRVQLPYSEIESLTQVEIAARSTVYLYTRDVERSLLLQSELEDAYKTHRKEPFPILPS